MSMTNFPSQNCICMPGGMAVGRFFVVKRRRAWGLVLVAVMVPLLVAGYWAWPVVEARMERVIRAIAAGTASRRLPIYSVWTEEKIAAISFDAAWGADKTRTILDILDEYGIKTTFFLVTFWVEKYPDEAREMVARGHEIGLHSSTHPDFTALTNAAIREELTENHRVIKEITGVEPRLFRPPFGAYNDRVLSVVEDELGYLTIQWSVDSLDWRDVTPDDITRRILSRIHPGAIVLFHNNAESTPAALPRILSALQAGGWRIVPISQLLHPGPYTIDHEGRQIPKTKE